MSDRFSIYPCPHCQKWTVVIHENGMGECHSMKKNKRCGFRSSLLYLRYFYARITASKPASTIL